MARLLYTSPRSPAAACSQIGDQDQAIYGFNGATGQCFGGLGQLEGGEVLSIQQTRRCPEAVCRVAEHFRQHR